LKYAELFEAKYAGKYVEFGNICGAYMLRGIFFRIFLACV